MIAFVVEHDVSVTETGKRIIKDLRVRIHRVEAIKPGSKVSGAADSPGFVYAESGKSVSPPVGNL
ncbi:MAG: hypothetical protein LBD78_07235 [Spirochaetaceae bacterium]|nr:hypothetical protein [Spirochaetaceae bacterium]